MFQGCSFQYRCFEKPIVRRTRHLIRVCGLMSLLSTVWHLSVEITALLLPAPLACSQRSVRLPPWRHWRASRHCADTLILPGVSPVCPRVFPRGSGEVRWRFVQQGFSRAAAARKTPVSSTHAVERFSRRQYVEKPVTEIYVQFKPHMVSFCTLMPGTPHILVPMAP